MKLEVFGEEKPAESVRLKLEQLRDGDVAVVAVNETGRRLNKGYLLTFKADGTIHRSACVSEYLGFQLEGSGRIKVGI